MPSPPPPATAEQCRAARRVPPTAVAHTEKKVVPRAMRSPPPSGNRRPDLDRFDPALARLMRQIRRQASEQYFDYRSSVLSFPGEQIVNAERDQEFEGDHNTDSVE